MHGSCNNSSAGLLKRILNGPWGTAVLTLLVSSICLVAPPLRRGTRAAPDGLLDDWRPNVDVDLSSLDCDGDSACAVNLIQRSAVVHHRVTPQHGGGSKDASSSDLPAASQVGYPGSVEQPIVIRHILHTFSKAWLENGLPANFVNVSLILTWAWCSFYVVCTIMDVSKLWHYSRQPDRKAEPATDQEQPWSSIGIWMLCFYRLYTGFLAATWLPYVLAMEGQALWPNNQSLFMGIAKLIYGITVLMNPIFGIIGDMLAEICQGAARRLWILLGIVLSAFGIMVCLWAGPRHDFYTYMLGITLWRLGESLNDVTTEAIVPELVPTSQFALASSIKAASFLMGGLLGYMLLFFMADVHYTWCYFAYLGSMFVCAIPSLVLLVNDSPGIPNPHRAGRSFARNLSEAYLTPCTFEGGFPQISLAIFVMSCGTAPMFFFLLIIRDLLEIHQEAPLQRDFAVGSVLFFLAAAIATILDVVYGNRAGPSSRGTGESPDPQDMSPHSRSTKLAENISWEKEKIRRLRILVVISAVYALVVLCIPLVQLFHSYTGRFAYFYPLIALFGGTFGLGYSRFQDGTWRLLPMNCDMANAMGFNVMARNFGLGVGNFFFGAMLEYFKVAHRPTAMTTTTTSHITIQDLTGLSQTYTAAGYDFMCAGCMVFNVIAGLIAYRITWFLPDPEVIPEAG